jgi:hypothetical protein
LKIANTWFPLRDDANIFRAGIAVVALDIEFATHGTARGGVHIPGITRSQEERIAHFAPRRIGRDRANANALGNGADWN